MTSKTKHIDYNELDNLPSRNDFIDKELNDQIKEDIKDRKNVYFMPNTVEESTRYSKGVNKYIVYIIGVLGDGTRAMVTLENIEVYFDTLVEDCETAEGLKANMQTNFQKKGIYYTKVEIVKGYKQNEFSTKPSDWIRFHFNNLKDRHDAILYVHKLDRPGWDGVVDGYQEKRKTANDDDGGFIHNFYFPKIARERAFNTCGWNRLPAECYSFTKLGSNNHPSTNCDYCFYVDVGNYLPASDQEMKEYYWAARDKTLNMTWDIETYTHSDQSGAPPTPEDTNWDVFMICMTFHWFYTSDALIKVCLVDKMTAGTNDLNEYVFYDDEEIEEEAHKLLKKHKIGHKVTIDEEPVLLDKFRKQTKEKQSICNYIIECGNERNILMAFTRIIKRMSPDMITAFNGGGFDWPMVREKLRRYSLLTTFKKSISTFPLNIYTTKSGHTGGDTEDKIYKYSWSNERVKISAEEMLTMLRLNIPGILDTDCMIVFKQMYPRSEVKNQYSLNFFLKKNKLKGKQDLPYKTMFKFYKQALDVTERKKEVAIEVTDAIITKMLTLGKDPNEIQTIVNAKRDEIVERKMQDLYLQVRKNMAEVAKYCVVDAFRCQQLYNIRAIVSEKREIGNGAYVPLFAAFYRAGGMKVRHIVGNACYNYDKVADCKIMFSNARPSNKKVKFPGAWVFPPKKGLNTKRPVVGLDFASLYPSLMMCYNLSPEKSIEDRPGAKKMVEELEQTGYILHRIDFVAEVTDDNAPDCGSHFPVGGWTVRHSNVHNPGDKVDFIVNGVPHKRQGEEPLPGEMMGIFPSTELKLYNERRVMKKRFVALDRLIERMEVIVAENEKIGNYPYDYSSITEADLEKTGYTREQLLNELTRDTILDEIIFDCNKTNAKQKAKKIFMNTFYGEQGNTLSSIFKLLVAGGVTAGGQYNIKMVAELCASMQYFVWYGDTDSCYISSPDSLFENVDHIYELFAGNAKTMISKYNGEDITYKDIPEHDVEFIAGKFILSHTAYREAYKKEEGKLKCKEVTLEEFNLSNEENYKKYCEEIFRIATEVSASNITDTQRKHLWKLTFYRLREEYWIMMVQITRRDLTRLADYVNDHLKRENGTGYLRMDYEEVLFPVVFTGKKKYFGFQHLEEENFHPKAKDIFIRGIDIIKQGQSDLAREIGMEIIEEVCSVFNDSEMIDLVHQKIKQIYATKWDLRHFILNAKYRPHKKNVSINTFADRMRDRHSKYNDSNGPWFDPIKAATHAPPEAGDPFQYVVVKRDQSYDIRGRKIDLKKGDRMEYVAVYEASQETEDPYHIDLNYYMEGAIQGLFARFIAYREEFVAPANIDVDQEDAYSIKLSKKYVEEYCNKISGVDKEGDRLVGRNYQRITRSVEKQIKQKIDDQNETSLSVIINNMKLPIAKVGSVSTNTDAEFNQGVIDTIEIADQYAKELAELSCREFNVGEAFVKKMKHRWENNPGPLYDINSEYRVKMTPKGIKSGTRHAHAEQLIQLRKKALTELCPTIFQCLQEYNYEVNELIIEARKRETIIDDDYVDYVANFDQQILGHFRQFYNDIIDLAGAYYYKKFLNSISYALHGEIAKRTRTSTKPDIDLDCEKNRILDIKCIDEPEFT